MSPLSSSEAASSPSPETRKPDTGRVAVPETGRGAAHQLHRIRRWSLAFADVTGIAAGVLVATEIGKMTPENQLWAIAIAPIWILVAKLYNLYDRDDRRIQHHTIEELPSLLAVAAITAVVAKGLTLLLPVPAVSAAALAGLAGSAVAAGGWFWSWGCMVSKWGGAASCVR